jgi:hypothetical protein
LASQNYNKNTKDNAKIWEQLFLAAIFNLSAILKQSEAQLCSVFRVCLEDIGVLNLCSNLFGCDFR